MGQATEDDDVTTFVTTAVRSKFLIYAPCVRIAVRHADAQNVCFLKLVWAPAMTRLGRQRPITLRQTNGGFPA